MEEESSGQWRTLQLPAENADILHQVWSQSGGSYMESEQSIIVIGMYISW